MKKHFPLLIAVLLPLASLAQEASSASVSYPKFAPLLRPDDTLHAIPGIYATPGLSTFTKLKPIFLPLRTNTPVPLYTIKPFFLDTKLFNRNVSPLDSYIHYLVSKDKNCLTGLSTNELDFINNLKKVSDKMSCDEFKKKNQSTVPNTENLKLCSCLAKEDPKFDYDDKFQKKFYGEITRVTTEKYIAPLLSSRLMEYSLGEIFKDGSSPCRELSTDPYVQGLKDHIFIDPKSPNYKYSSALKSLLSPLDREMASSLYNYNNPSPNQTQNIPVITKKDLEYFADLWGKSLSEMNDGDSSRILNFLDQVQNKSAETIDIHSACAEAACSTFGAPAAVGMPEFKEKNHNAAKALEANISYLENIFRLRGNGDKTPLLEKIRQKLNKEKMVVPQGSTEEQVRRENLIAAFRAVIKEEMGRSCEKSREVLKEVAQGNLSRIMSDPEFVKGMEKSGPLNANAQKMQCRILQNQFYKDPKGFVKNYCHYEESAKVSVEVACRNIGDLIESQFIDPQSSEDKKKMDVSANEIGKMISESSASSSAQMSKELDKVRITRSVSMETITKKIQNKESINLNEFNVTSSKSSYSSSQYQGPAAQVTSPSTEGHTPSTGMNFQTAAASLFGTGLKGNSPPSLPTPTVPVVTYERKDVIIHQGAQGQTSITPSSSSEEEDNDEENNVGPSKKKIKSSKGKAKLEDEDQEGEEDEEEIASATPAAEKTKSPSKKKKAQIVKNIQAPTPSFTSASTPAAAPMSTPSFNQVRSNPALVPDEAARQYVQARGFEAAITSGSREKKSDSLRDPHPPETGLMLTALKTGQIEGNSLIKVVLGDDIQDLKALERSHIFRGAVILVEDKDKKERYICRAYVGNDLLPVNTKELDKDKLSGYRCVTEKQAPAKDLAPQEKNEVKKIIANDERLYKAFVLERIIHSSKK